MIAHSVFVCMYKILDDACQALLACTMAASLFRRQTGLGLVTLLELDINYIFIKLKFTDKIELLLS